MPVAGSAQKRFKKLEQKIAKYYVFCCILMYDSVSQSAKLAVHGASFEIYIKNYSYLFPT